ncbi:histidine kinase [Salinibacterium sp. ZJ454]|uniref:sensor histidine kinase n=1 Tax=Salinibacterium sp. ZJ454 TaxID=2708339 RepID=UPI00141E9A4D|nr:histidine kinase [Salinibacterium sp. ZJ454]
MSSRSANYPALHTAAIISRRTLFLLLGGLVAIPYGAITLWGLTVFFSPEPAASETAARATVIGVLLVMALPAVLPVTRTLERAAASQLLDQDIPEPRHRATAADVARGALFFAGHLLSGGVLVFAVAFLVPIAVTVIADAATGRDAGASSLLSVLGDLGDFGDFGSVVAGSVVVVTIVATVLAVAVSVVAGYLFPWSARQLLGPSPADRRAAAAEELAKLARRTELARELHDSIGHALTVTTVQAAAARRVLASDPDRAMLALAEIERAGRAAVADLDYALGVLRAGESHGDTAPTRSLAEVEQLVAETRAAGIDLSFTSAGDLESLPASLSREAYRITQEGLTNAIRHASETSASLLIWRDAEHLHLRMSNPGGRARARRGRGISGIRERVTILGGTCSIGSRDGRWVVEVSLPLRDAAPRTPSRAATA